MRKARTFLILGVWIAILPYLGFPYSWKNILFTITGLVVIFLSYLMYQEHKPKEGKKNSFDNFRENSDFQERHEGELEVDVIEEDPEGRVRLHREV